jgi:hypothetical protein
VTRRADHPATLEGMLHRAFRMSAVTHGSVLDRVRANTWPDVNDRLDIDVQLRLRDAAGWSPDELTWRLAQVDREWTFDRALEAEAALMGLLGLALGVAVDRRLLVLPGFVSAMLVLHATHGWYPWLPIFRRVGLRTRDEIDRERYALKALRGDFDAIPGEGSPAAERASAAWKAVCR